jgi:membrane fusion protein, heavy metal efflux system
VRSALLLFSTLAFLVGCGRQPAPTPSDQSRQPAQTGRVVLPPDSPKLSEIRVEAVRAAEIPLDEVDSPGKIEVNPNRLAHVLLPLTGRIATVQVKLGDTVGEGQPLLTIESADADAAESGYVQASAGLHQAKANLIKAQADNERMSDLFQHHAVASKDVLTTENALAQARASVDQAEASQTQALRRLQILGLQPGHFGQKVVVRAPLAGKVLEITVVPGEYRNDPNASLMTVADLRTLWVTSDVPESSIRLIRPGERVDIELAAYPGETFYGRVTRLADTVDPQTRTVKVRAELDNSSGRFRPEMFGRIRHVESTRSAPVVPSGAVIQGDGYTFVFVEQSRGVFQQVPVKVGRPIGGNLPVLDGLKPGDRVVVDGAMLLKAS